MLERGRGLCNALLVLTARFGSGHLDAHVAPAALARFKAISATPFPLFIEFFNFALVLYLPLPSRKSQGATMHFLFLRFAFALLNKKLRLS